MIYLDWAATAIPDSEILDRVRDIEKEYYGNPSSIHAAGRKAKKILIQAREKLAGILQVDPMELIFTSGGTESNNMFINSFLVRAFQMSSVQDSISNKKIISQPGFFKKSKIIREYIE